MRSNKLKQLTKGKKMNLLFDAILQLKEAAGGKVISITFDEKVRCKLSEFYSISRSFDSAGIITEFAGIKIERENKDEDRIK